MFHVKHLQFSLFFNEEIALFCNVVLVSDGKESCGRMDRAKAFAEIIHYSRIIKIVVAKKPLENHTKFSSGFSMWLVADNCFDFIRF